MLTHVVEKRHQTRGRIGTCGGARQHSLGVKLDPCRFGGAFDLAWSVLAVHPASSSGDCQEIESGLMS